MGYSCTQAADYTLAAIHNLIGDPASGNRLLNGGFWERGRENRDGAITGKVWKDCPTKEGFVLLKGTFRIEPTGVISRWPGLTAKEKTKLLKMSYKLCVDERNEYHARYIYKNCLSEILDLPVGTSPHLHNALDL